MKKSQPQPTTPSQDWLQFAVLALAAVFLIGLFSTPIADTDFWWHLKSGQLIAQEHHLPVPDPFAYTTALHPQTPFVPFNLTQEWLGQTLLFFAWAIGGFPAVIVSRAILLAAICGLSG